MGFDADAHNRLRANFDLFVRNAGDDPARLLGIAKSASRLGMWEQSRALLLRARDCAPQGSELRRSIGGQIGGAIPSWHLSMLHDRQRNDAFERAIAANVRPGDRVLDIGTGSGLLAMMAVRAGAREVIAVEMDPLLADAAAQVVAQNGMADRIRVIPRCSTDLDAEADLGGPVDVIVGEILANNLLLEGVQPTMKHAAGHLLRPGGRMVPQSADIMVALCEWDSFHAFEDVSGFDLSAFNPLITTPRRMGADHEHLVMRSAPAPLFAFDFTDPAMADARSTRLMLECTGGPANGVAQWLRIRLDAEVDYENRPDAEYKSHWRPVFYPFDRPVMTEAGALLAIEGSHDPLSISIWKA
ncbi:50S ribosomal protein L11 methyltransferase [Croceicoccus sp. Ery5]|uniref:50S ribosomal protein L11 methyltransferase n=1 Tax=Croceicoccus sp. Ery5 TaxID=1703340 RepID=UPI001E5D64C7|nr:50S ribosomal protein L11 methyltransferase [Croceicoccus sp. Ery5]